MHPKGEVTHDARASTLVHFGLMQYTSCRYNMCVFLFGNCKQTRSSWGSSFGLSQFQCTILACVRLDVSRSGRIRETRYRSKSSQCRYVRSSRVPAMREGALISSPTSASISLYLTFFFSISLTGELIVISTDRGEQWVIQTMSLSARLSTITL